VVSFPELFGIRELDKLYDFDSFVDQSSSLSDVRLEMDCGLMIFTPLSLLVVLSKLLLFTSSSSSSSSKLFDLLSSSSSKLFLMVSV